MLKQLLCVFSILIAFSWMNCRSAVADWINLSGAQNAPNIAEIHINDDHVKIALEIYVKDLVAFDRLIPDAFFKGTDIKRASLAERLRQFSNEDLRVITSDGHKLQVDLQLIEPRYRQDRPVATKWKINPFTGQPIPGPPADKRVLYAELVYPFTGKPTKLTFIPPMEDNYKTSAVGIGFITYHKNVPLHDFRYLSEPSTVTLDWDDPWYSKFANKALKRWQPGGVLSFLYIEPYEVRHEILARVKDLEAWMDLGLRGDEFIEADENDVLKKRVGAFWLERDKTLIDGQQLRPILDRVSFIKFSTTASVFIQQPEQLPINTTMVGVIITYLTPGIPQEITNEWDLWSDRIQKIPTNAIDPAGPFPSYITPEDNVHTWTNFLKTYQIPTVAEVSVDRSWLSFQLPWASILCLLALLPLGIYVKRQRNRTASSTVKVAGLAVLLLISSLVLFPFFKISVAKPVALAPEMGDEKAVQILDNLLNNIYRSFDFREEEDVYDRLATSVSGDLLTEIYLQNRKGLVVQQAGGAQARVKKVDILNVDVSLHQDLPWGLVFRATWSAMGSVGHWGHIHNRKNQYEANIIVEPVEGSWKITNLELLEEKRIDAYPKTTPTPNKQ